METKRYKIKEPKQEWWLCVGTKTIPKCLYASIEIVDRNKPLWASSMRVETIKSLSVYCNFSHCFIRETKTHCCDFQNKTLLL